jgi:hypothetical protein
MTSSRFTILTRVILFIYLCLLSLDSLVTKLKPRACLRGKCCLHPSKNNRVIKGLIHEFKDWTNAMTLLSSQLVLESGIVQTSENDDSIVDKNPWDPVKFVEEVF